ncbi:DUF4232 domain-containing protein [Saccharomonospora xinjiangensis]|uniref:DUF4232 domain-containing protein n=1 Tax=Saccharomonospora xinjiangensis TaxID=75294 RepID=UPI00106F59AE|nr:DUF4232 domain-containing protein [Saccharomonospora xinjiangensis]QBQ60351.1 hypothetical protein EYD13_09980 [Saccharomonospora xinjiangensis]
MKRWGFVLPALLVATACAAEPEPPAPPPAPEPTVEAACPDSGVRVEAGLSEAASGLRVLALHLTNCGRDEYHLDGYPLLRVLDTGGEPLDVEVAHTSAGIATVEGFDTPPEPLTLRPGETATTRLMWRNTVTEAGAPGVGESLSIAPAEGRPWQPVEAGDDPGGLHIDVGSTGMLGVRAWHL